MKIRIVTLLACASLAACQTTDGKTSKDLKDYPEALAYRDCMWSRAVAYAPQNGSPLELGLIAANLHSSSKRALGRDPPPRQTGSSGFGCSGMMLLMCE